MPDATQPYASPELSTVPVPEIDDQKSGALDVILQISGGYCVSRALHVVANLGVADAIADAATPIGEVAATTGADPDALGRVLRLLSAHGLFTVDSDGVSHNEASKLLRSDHPQSARDLARMLGLPFMWKSFEELEHTVRTGQPASERAFPEGVWSWLSQRPDANAIFNSAMIGKSVAQVSSVVQAYDFSRFSQIGDIGGGRGHLLRAILDRWSDAHGVLFEQPHVIAEAVADPLARLDLVGGDFFKDALPTCDAYILMEVIHDWPDKEALEILSAVRRAAPAGARLLLIEQLLPEAPGPHWVKMLDIHMLTLFGARQRSREEYDRLVEHAGFKPVRATQTSSGISIMEAVVEV